MLDGWGVKTFEHDEFGIKVLKKREKYKNNGDYSAAVSVTMVSPDVMGVNVKTFLYL